MAFQALLESRDQEHVHDLHWLPAALRQARLSRPLAGREEAVSSLPPAGSSPDSAAAAELFRKLLAEPETAVLVEPAASGGWIVVVDTSWVTITDEEKALIEELLRASSAASICPKCHLQTPILVNGTKVDACFGDMLGNVINACCGHGDPARAYVRIKRLHGNSGSPCVDICGGEVVGYDVWTERQRSVNHEATEPPEPLTVNPLKESLEMRGHRLDAEGKGPELTTVPPDWEGFDEQGRGWYFHLREGFYFRGRGDAVTISVKCEGGYRTITVPPNEWASAVASVSKRGDVQSAFSEALAVHETGDDAAR